MGEAVDPIKPTLLTGAEPFRGSGGGFRRKHVAKRAGGCRNFSWGWAVHESCAYSASIRQR